MERRYYNRELETMPRADFERYQWELLQRQINYTYSKSPLCQKKFKEAGITPDDIKTKEDFRNKVPFTTKNDLIHDQQENPPWGTRLAISEKDIVLIYLTSGTSGRGQEVHTMNAKDRDLMTNALVMRCVWSGMGKGDRFVNVWPRAFNQGSVAWDWAMDQLGIVVLPLGIYDTKTKIEYMTRFKVNTMLSSAVYLEALEREAEKMGLDVNRDLRIEHLGMMGPYPLSTIQKVEEKWGSKVYEGYASTQWGVGGACENGALVDGKRGKIHLMEYVAYYEWLNPDTLEPVVPGEEGELVVTPFKEGSPFLRFRTADKVRYFPYNACDCGRPFDCIEAGTIARYDDMMKIKGLNIWPQTIDDIVLTKPEIIEYQGKWYIDDRRKEEAEIAVEFKEGVCSDVKLALLNKIIGEIQNHTGIRFNVIEAEGQLARQSFKPKRWTDERLKGLERK